MGAIGGIGFAALIAGLVAYIELLARYRDDPIRALRRAPAALYGLINAGTGALAAWWLCAFSPSLVAASSTGTPLVIDGVKLAIVAGFGSLAVLRTSLLKLRTSSGDDISVGPAVIIDQLMTVIDRSVDRHLAEHRSAVAAELAARFNFDTQAASLVSLCLVLLQNPSPTDEQQITSVMRSLIGRNDLTAGVKAMSLLLTLVNLVGEKVLRRAVGALTPAVAKAT